MESLLGRVWIFFFFMSGAAERPSIKQSNEAVPAAVTLLLFITHRPMLLVDFIIGFFFSILLIFPFVFLSISMTPQGCHSNRVLSGVADVTEVTGSIC